MLNLIIRDDDLSYFTTVEDIEKRYKILFDRKIKISFAVIPFAVKQYHSGNRKLMYQDEIENPLENNSQIIEYMSEKVKDGLVEIMLHGYKHQYSFEYNGKVYKATKTNLDKYRHLGIKWLGEYNYQSYEELYKKTKKGKEYLEDIFKIKIKNFVPPSNQIGSDGIKALIDNNLNLSGLIGKKYNRELTIRGILTYIYRIKYYLQNRDLVYPKISDYGKHKELAGYALTPITNWDRYYKQLDYCKDNKLPFQIATHYWELDGELLEIFYEFIDYALGNGMKSVLLKEILK